MTAAQVLHHACQHRNSRSRCNSEEEGGAGGATSKGEVQPGLSQGSAEKASTARGRAAQQQEQQRSGEEREQEIDEPGSVEVTGHTQSSVHGGTDFKALKLAPILARRLEIVASTSSSTKASV